MDDRDTELASCRELQFTRLLKALERDLDALGTCVLGKPAAQRIARRLRTRVRKLRELFEP